MSSIKNIDKVFSDLLNCEFSGDQNSEYNQLLKQIASFNADLKNFVQQISLGDFEVSLNYKGKLAGSMKALQSNLRHLAWQTSQVASGDLSQKVTFMGNFSHHFNTMIESLSSNRSELIEQNRKLACLNNELEADRQLAARVQQHILGELEPVAYLEHGQLFLPATMVSGDFFFDRVISDNQACFFLGDASGHGTAAALVSILTRTALAELLSENDLSMVFKRLNQILADSLPDEMYLTGIFARINPDGNLEIINAAHPAGLVWRADSGEIVEFPATGMALGLFEDFFEDYSLVTDRLNPGDRLFLFSDGLSEMKLGDKDFNFKDFLRSQKNGHLSNLMGNIKRLIEENHQEKALADDITLIAIEYSGITTGLNDCSASAK